MKPITYFLRYASLIFLPLTYLQSEETPPQEMAPKKQALSGWLEGEYLYLWLKNSPAPVTMVTEGPTLDQQTTVLGGKSLDTGGRSGGRFGAGIEFGTDQRFGIEGDYLFLSSSTYKKTIYSSGEPGSNFLLLPFFDPSLPGDTVDFLAQPIALDSYPAYSGLDTLTVKNSMQDAELNGTFKILCCNLGSYLQIFTGFLWWNFNEHLTFTTDSPYVSIPEEIFLTKDQFRTHNNFYGGQIGLEGKYLWKKLSLLLKGQVALGGMNQKLKIQGEFTTNDFDNYTTAQTFNGGYFALPTNEGSFSQTQLSVIPQVNAQFAYQIAKWLDINVGYTFLYATNVMWASNQLDNDINSTQSVAIKNAPTSLVGAAEPQPLFKTSGFWAQGITVGLQFQF